MNATTVLNRVIEARALVLLRAERIDLTVLDAYVAGGLRTLEVSMVASDAIATIRSLRDRHPDTLVGAGTVRTVDSARAAVEAGAEFLVSPSMAPAVAAWARAHDVLHVPGVFSPSEVDAALQSGARLLKLFPAGRLGPGYITDLLAPFPEALFLVSGGVSIETAAAYLAAGASVVGMGGALAASSNPDDVRQLSASLMKAAA